MSRAALLVAATAAAVVASAAAARPAAADVLVIYGDAQGGGMFGKGTAGDQKDAAFFGDAPNGMYGARVGARFLILGAAIQHHQYTDFSDLSTWTQFSAGLDLQFGLGSPAEKKARKGTFFGLSAMLGLGLGTGQQVMPPLSNDEITDKAFLIEGRLSYGKHLNKVFDIGFELPVSWGYFFKNGAGDAANDTSTHYQGIQAEGLVFLRANIKLL